MQPLENTHLHRLQVTFLIQKQITTQKTIREMREKREGQRERTPEVKHSLTTTNWLSPAKSPVFYVLFIPLAAEYKRPSVTCAALMNNTSSAKSKTRGHGRHHHRFVNRQGRLGIMPAGACCQSSKGHRRWLGWVTVGNAGQSEGLVSTEVRLREVAIRETSFRLHCLC